MGLFELTIFSILSLYMFPEINKFEPNKQHLETVSKRIANTITICSNTIANTITKS